MKEKNYIRYRKIRAFCNSLCFYVCRIFPIKKNKIAVCTFEGKGGFCCNPKYIVQELHKRDEEYEIVWFVNDMSKEFPDYIKKVPNTLWSRAYHLSTAKVWIDNYRKPLGTKKRRGQYYLNTWHGMIGFKSIGLWRGKNFSKMAYIVSKNDSKMVDHFLCDSEFCREFFPKGLLYDGEFLMVGSPRCDIFSGERKKYKERFKTKNNLPSDTKLIMYAPTFREKSQKGKRGVFLEKNSLDLERLIHNLESKFGGKWIPIVRFHPQLADYENNIADLSKNISVVDVSHEDDMYELLVAMDAFITDYSSAAMDAALLNIPIFIYADDLQYYQKSRGDFVWDISEESKEIIYNNKEMTPGIHVEFPFSIAQNNDELEVIIRNFQMEDYLDELECYKKNAKVIFDGNASMHVVDHIEEIVG